MPGSPADGSGNLAASIGENVARFRKAVDLSQEGLADAAGVGVDTIARLEQGKRATTRPSTLRKIAAALGISVDALIGRSSSQLPADLGITALRQTITIDEEVPGLTGQLVESAETIPIEQLERETRRAWQAYVDGHHDELLTVLPMILVDARRLVHAATGDDKARAYRSLSTAYRLGAGISSRLGFTDLSWSSAERALQAARSCDSPELETAISLRYLAWTLVRQGRLDEAESVATNAAEEVQPAMLDRDLERAGVFGNLLFNAATAAVLAGRHERANDLLAEAQAAAIRSNADFANEAAIFGTRVTALQRVDHAARTGDPERALHLADTMHAPQGEVPAFWEAGYNLSLAAAATDLQNHTRALHHLACAYELAPGWAPQQPLGRRTMRELVDRASRRQGEAFARLARLYGVLV